MRLITAADEKYPDARDFTLLLSFSGQAKRKEHSAKRKNKDFCHEKCPSSPFETAGSFMFFGTQKPSPHLRGSFLASLAYKPKISRNSLIASRYCSLLSLGAIVILSLDCSILGERGSTSGRGEFVAACAGAAARAWTEENQ